MPENMDIESGWAEIHRLIGSVEAPANWSTSSSMQPYQSYTDPWLRRAVKWHDLFLNIAREDEWASLGPKIGASRLAFQVEEFVLSLERIIHKKFPNSYRCASCYGLAISTSRHHYQSCSCGKIAVDGGDVYGRRIGDLQFFQTLGTDFTDGFYTVEEEHNDRQ